MDADILKFFKSLLTAHYLPRDLPQQQDGDVDSIDFGTTCYEKWLLQYETDLVAKAKIHNQLLAPSLLSGAFRINARASVTYATTQPLDRHHHHQQQQDEMDLTLSLESVECQPTFSCTLERIGYESFAACSSSSSTSSGGDIASSGGSTSAGSSSSIQRVLPRPLVLVRASFQDPSCAVGGRGRRESRQRTEKRRRALLSGGLRGEMRLLGHSLDFLLGKEDSAWLVLRPRDWIPGSGTTLTLTNYTDIHSPLLSALRQLLSLNLYIYTYTYTYICILTDLQPTLPPTTPLEQWAKHCGEI
jgi:hypothetical protein